MPCRLGRVVRRIEENYSNPFTTTPMASMVQAEQGIRYAMAHRRVRSGSGRGRDDEAVEDTAALRGSLPLHTCLPRPRQADMGAKGGWMDNEEGP